MLFEPFTLHDLTHPLSPETPTWDGSCGFCMKLITTDDERFRLQQVNMFAGIGTHMDAPSHCFPDRDSIADIPLAHLFVPACVIDVSTKADADYEISLADIQEYEKRYGQIPPQALVIAFTGWSRFWNQAMAYRNPDAKGQMHFPAFSRQAAEFLLTRDIAGIAIDTLSPDCADREFSVHQLILGAGKYIIENLADCSSVPAKGAYVLALPLKLPEGTESPLRVIALVPSFTSPQ